MRDSFVLRILLGLSPQVCALEDPPFIYRVPRVPRLKEDNGREGFVENHQYRSMLSLLLAPLQPVFVVAREIQEAGRRMQLYLEQLGNAETTEKPTECSNAKPS